MRLCVFLLLLLQPIPSADQRPLALSEVDDAARYLFESARETQWDEAQAQLRTLQDAFEDLPSGLGPADVFASARSRVHELPDSVARHDRVAVMEGANAITGLVIGLSERYQSNVPAQIPRLAYLGRQIELGIASHNPTMIARATDEIQQTWNEVRPELEQRKHLADVRRMTDIVASLETGKPTRDGPLARAELDAVSHLETEFK